MSIILLTLDLWYFRKQNLLVIHKNKTTDTLRIQKEISMISKKFYKAELY